MGGIVFTVEDGPNGTKEVRGGIVFHHLKVIDSRWNNTRMDYILEVLKKEMEFSILHEMFEVLEENNSKDLENYYQKRWVEAWNALQENFITSIQGE